MPEFISSLRLDTSASDIRAFHHNSIVSSLLSLFHQASVYHSSTRFYDRRHSFFHTTYNDFNDNTLLLFCHMTPPSLRPSNPIAEAPDISKEPAWIRTPVYLSLMHSDGVLYLSLPSLTHTHLKAGAGLVRLCFQRKRERKREPDVHTPFYSNLFSVRVRQCFMFIFSHTEKWWGREACRM